MYSAFMQFNEVFVTGGTGLLGRHVCGALIGHGFLPRLFVRTGSEGRIAPDVRERCRVTPGDLTVCESGEMGAQGTSAIGPSRGYGRSNLDGESPSRKRTCTRRPTSSGPLRSGGSIG
jgi:hypothetical protein